MKKLTLALYIGLISTAILNMLPMQGMENNAQFAAQAEEYNDTECLLFKLPNEILFEIFLHRFSDGEISIGSLHNDVKHLMPLNVICKRFNKLLTLETTSRLYKNCLNKNEVLREIIRQLDNRIKYKSLSILGQVLVHAGADAQTMLCSISALEIAIQQNEENLVRALLKHGANPDIVSTHSSKKPILFKAKTILIAQMLMDTGKVNIHATDKFEMNVLHNMTPACYPPALMEFYLDHKVDATKLTYHNFCILHEFALMYFHYLSDSENMLEKIKILLNVVPHMINALTIDGKTPIDIVQENFDIEINGVYCGNPAEVAKQKDSYCEDFEKIITIFRSHGGLTAEELAETNSLDSHK